MVKFVYTIKYFMLKDQLSWTSGLLTKNIISDYNSKLVKLLKHVSNWSIINAILFIGDFFKFIVRSVSFNSFFQDV